MSSGSADVDLELDKQLLLEIARAKRSKVKNLRPLKELALEKLVSSNECDQRSIAPFRYLQVSPLLQREILSHMVTHASDCRRRMRNCGRNRAPVVKFNWLFELASHLLSVHTKEFDFSIFDYPFLVTTSDDKQRVWMMLVDKCPNLESILDQSRGLAPAPNPKLCSVMSYLQNFPKLKHILLAHYFCTSEDLAQLAQHLPQLQTLSVAFKYFFSDTLQNLLLLQNLERVDITLRHRYSHEFENELLKNEHEQNINSFKADCMEHLPRLQYCSGGEEHHNYRPYEGNRKLSMKEIDVLGGFDFELVPFLEKLKLTGPDLNIPCHSFRLLSNLTVLDLLGFETSNTSDVLTHCGDKLHELFVRNWSENGMDPYEVFFKCPQLRTLKISECSVFRGESTFQSQMVAKHVKHLKHFEYMTPFFPPDFLAFVLAAPDLEIFSSYKDWNLSSMVLARLSVELVEGCILQNLKLINFENYNGRPNACVEFVKFLKLLPFYAPALQWAPKWLIRRKGQSPKGPPEVPDPF
ncbi:uncharacterized protein LOC132195013 [Neocloeon triangulifer]|uniref:uncharacterized protein LOC132195013 n=1 Tax=Neocloeon triangulifer TaxID=2078957 RepID=UPI00286FA243|nr:uncharacterized protein LOC132195013 [Neocloeon triangulifer]